MAAAQLNLAGLSEKELLHIKEVLLRDKKMQQTISLVSPTMNNNNTTRRKGKHEKQSTNEVVMAEIERVHQLKPKPGGSRKNTPSPSDSESSDEGFFSSFAGFISRGMVAIGGKKKRSSAEAAHEKKDTPKAPFKYNPRETIRKKPTLLELADSRRCSSPPILTGYHSVSADEDEITSCRRQRNNAMFSSLPATHTVPRNYKSGHVVIQLPALTQSRPRSPPSEPDKVDDRQEPSTMLTPGSPLQQPRVLISEASEDRTSPFKSATSGGYKSDSTSSRENVSIGENSDKSPSEIPSKLSLPLHPGTPVKERSILETIIVGANVPDPVSLQNSDSEISPSKSEFFMRKGGNESLIEYENGTDNRAVYGYEPDIESVGDVDSRQPADYGDDDVSLTSASSSYYDSPMKRIHRDFVQDSWDESDCSSGVSGNQKRNVIQLSMPDHLVKNVSPGSHKPRWVKQRKHKREKSWSNGLTENPISFSPVSSPSLSHRSIPDSRPSSPTGRHEMIPSPLNNLDTIGNLELSLIYYSAETFNRKNRTRTEIPSNGTKSDTEKNCHVLSRREYVEVTGADLELTDDSVSGAPEASNGELHVTIQGAKFQDSNGKIKSPSTYVKCYLLPDKFHNSKMKSAVIKKSKEPKWNHKFILAGFSQSELRERSLEIIVGSWHFKRQEVLGGAILSVGQGGHPQLWINSTKSEAYIWKTVLQISGNKVKTLLPLRAHMKPTYV